MIITKITGGLGNQMFQYAYGRKLAMEWNMPLKLDRSELEGNRLATPRKFELDHFNVVLDFPTPAELNAVKLDEERGVVNKLLMKFKQRGFPVQSSHILEGQPLHKKNAIYLDGYWQSEKYFNDIAALIRKEFTPRHGWDKNNEEVLGSIQSTQAVSIHVRRGDYVTNAVANSYHGTCSPAYYQQAVSYIAQRVQDPVYFVFSDDLEWCRGHLDFGGRPAHFIGHNGGDRAFMDIMLMRNCQHHIIANSSFSWWGAWLNDRADKLVIAPNRWFTQKDDNNIVPESWIRL